mmetsp:Transcript_12552/g.29729  ORF Transcript_12552/g.29729 Transcript_12552/m.29729 type:complete len:209 (+) Transcript_12552:579-1205(+)
MGASEIPLRRPAAAPACSRIQISGATRTAAEPSPSRRATGRPGPARPSAASRRPPARSRRRRRSVRATLRQEAGSRTCSRIFSRTRQALTTRATGCCGPGPAPARPEAAAELLLSRRSSSSRRGRPSGPTPRRPRGCQLEVLAQPAAVEAVGATVEAGARPRRRRRRPSRTQPSATTVCSSRTSSNRASTRSTARLRISNSSSRIRPV